MRIKILKILFGGLRKRENRSICMKTSFCWIHQLIVNIQAFTLFVVHLMNHFWSLLERWGRRSSFWGCISLQEMMLWNYFWFLFLACSHWMILISRWRNYSEFIKRIFTMSEIVIVICLLWLWFFSKVHICYENQLNL